MILVLVRHGIAVRRDDPECPPDFERPLTAKGADRTTRAARGLRTLAIAPEVILSSHLLRAVQTAELIADVLEVPHDRIERTNALDIDADPEELFRLLRQRPEQSVLCCGHAPNLDWILSASIDGEDRINPFKKCGGARIDFEREWGQAGELRWFRAPRDLRELGESPDEDDD